MNDEEVILRVRDGMAKWVGELIRCKDCVRYEDNRVCDLYHAVLDDDDYCSRAERRER